MKRKTVLIIGIIIGAIMAFQLLKTALVFLLIMSLIGFGTAYYLGRQLEVIKPIKEWRKKK